MCRGEIATSNAYKIEIAISVYHWLACLAVRLSLKSDKVSQPLPRS